MWATLRKCALLLGLLVCASSASGQGAVKQSGTVTPSHSVRWIANGVVGDGGTASNPLLSSIGTAGSGPTICASSATTGALNRVCLSSTATGGGITMNNIGGGTGGFTFTLNGVVQGIVTVTLPVTANDGACFADNTGTLRDCGGAPIIIATPCVLAGGFPVFNGAAYQCSTAALSTAILNGGPFTINTTASTSTQGLLINQTGTSSSLDPAPFGFSYNNITIQSDSNATSAFQDYTTGFQVLMGTGGAHSDGSKAAGWFTLYASGAGLNQPTVNGDHVGLVANGFAQVNAGGTNTGAGAKGTMFGLSVRGQATGTATNWASIVGAEIDVGITTGASAKLRFGLEVADTGNLQAASIYDAAIVVGAASTAPGFKNAFYLSSVSGAAPLSTTGCAFCTDGAAVAITTGIDLSSYTFSGNFLAGPGFTVAGTGLTTISRNNIQIASTDGLVLQNTQAATVGGQQYSPRLRLTGAGWKTNATAGSQVVDWIMENIPVQGTANPTTDLAWSSQINGGSYTAQMLLTSSNGLTVGTTANTLANAGDLTVARSSTTGFIYAGSGGTTFFGYDGSKWAFTPGIALTSLATQATNTVLGNATSGTAVPTALAVGTCSTAASALIWTTNTGFGCNTSITAAAVPASGLTGATLASGVTASSLTSLGTITSLTATTINAFTLGGTISGGGNQLNNIIIGTSTPLAGAFTTLTTTSTIVASGDTTISVADATQFSIKNPSAIVGSCGGGGSECYTAFQLLNTSNIRVQAYWAEVAAKFVFNTTVAGSYIDFTPNAVQTARFHASGAVAIGSTTTDPGANNLGVTGKIFAPNLATTTAALGAAICWTVTTGEFQRDTNAGGCLVSSERYKHGIRPLEDGLSVVMGAHPVSFFYNDGVGAKGEQVGFIAEQMGAMDNRLVGYGDDGRIQSFRYMQYTAVITRAVQQLKADNDNLRAEITKLKQRRAK